MNRLFSVFIITSILIVTILPVSGQRLSKATSGHAVKPAELNEFGVVEAFTDGHGAFVRWQMNVETDNVGFNVYRIGKNGEELVSQRMVLGSKARVGEQALYGEQYSIFDRNGGLGSVYYVESLDGRGKRLFSSKSAASYTPDISVITGRSSESMIRSETDRVPVLSNAILNLPKELSSEVESAISVPDPVTQKAVAATPGVKIGVLTDGFYRIDRNQLQANGFNVASDPQYWKLYCDGVEQAINVQGYGDAVEFIGRAKETIESDKHYYYLVVGTTPGKRMRTSVSRPTGVPVTSRNYTQTTFVKQRINYVNDILNGDAENYWGNVVTSSGTTFNFTLTGVDPTADVATVNVKFQGFSSSAHSVALSLNGQPIPPAVGNATNPLGSIASIPASALAEGTNSLSMTSSASADFVLFDSISVTYSRRYFAADNSVAFYTKNYRSSTVTGFTSPAIRLFDVTDDGEPVEVTNLGIVTENGNSTLYLPSSRGRSMFAVEASAVKSVATMEFNNPSTLSTPDHNAKLVIITYPSFARDAARWASYRQGHGISTEVVDVRDIYDEFSYGQPSSLSIKSFLQYAANNWATPPQYVLLLGDASYDCKNYEGLGYTNLVPTKIVNTVYLETGSDDALADFDGDGLAELSIGRIPARTTQDVSNALAKVQAFEQPAMQDLSRGAIFAYDLPNGYDFQGMSATLRNNLPGSMPAVMIGRGDVNSQTTLINEINNGRYIVNYSGHGSTGIWATASFFGIASVPALTNVNNQSIFTMLTCLNGYFINPYGDSLAESLLKAQNGGAVASWASTGLTTPDIQLIMANRFYSQIAAGNITRMGDLVRDAKAQIPAGSDVRFSWVLIGDPMLKVRQ